MDSNQSGAVGGIIWGPFPESLTHFGASRGLQSHKRGPFWAIFWPSLTPPANPVNFLVFFCKKGHFPQQIWLKTCIWSPKHILDLNPRASKWAVPCPKILLRRGVGPFSVRHFTISGFILVQSIGRLALLIWKWLLSWKMLAKKKQTRQGKKLSNSAILKKMKIRTKEVSHLTSKLGSGWSKWRPQSVVLPPTGVMDY